MASPAAASHAATTLPMIETLRACTHDVFGTMVGTNLDDGALLAADAPPPHGNVVGQIGFGGSTSGLVAFYTTTTGAALITQAMLCIDTPPTTEEVADAIGEVVNMVAGSFRTRMATEGDTWAISIPSVTIGTDFSMTPLRDGRRTVLPFRMGEHEIFVELVVTPGQGRRA